MVKEIRVVFQNNTKQSNSMALPLWTVVWPYCYIQCSILCGNLYSGIATIIAWQFAGSGVTLLSAKKSFLYHDIYNFIYDMCNICTH